MAQVTFVGGSGGGAAIEPLVRMPSANIHTLNFAAPGILPFVPAPAAGLVRTSMTDSSAPSGSPVYIADGDFDVRLFLNGNLISEQSYLASVGGDDMDNLPVYAFLNGEALTFEIVSMLGTYVKILVPYVDISAPGVARSFLALSDVPQDLIPLAPAGKANIAFNPFSFLTGSGFWFYNPDTIGHTLNLFRDDGVDTMGPLSIGSVGPAPNTNPLPTFPFTGPGESSETAKLMAATAALFATTAPYVFGLYREVNAA